MIVRRGDVLEYKGTNPKDDKNEKQDIDENVEEVDKDHRILHYTKENIQEYIDKVKELVGKGRYTIPLQANRNENKRFIERYNLNSKKRKQILENLTVYDFCYGTRNRNEGYEHEILYVFSKEYEDTFPEGDKKIQIYIKMNLLEPNNEFVVVISFHEYTGEVKTLFEKE